MNDLVCLNGSIFGTYGTEHCDDHKYVWLSYENVNLLVTAIVEDVNFPDFPLLTILYWYVALLSKLTWIFGPRF